MSPLLPLYIKEKLNKIIILLKNLVINLKLAMKVDIALELLMKCKQNFSLKISIKNFIRSEKLREIKRRMEEIVKLPRHQWTVTDAEFMDIALEPKMYNLLKNVQL